MRLVVNINKIVLVLGGIICFLILAGIARSIARHSFGITNSYLVELFNPDSEKNIPTLFSTLLLMSCSILLGLIASSEEKR